MKHNAFDSIETADYGIRHPVTQTTIRWEVEFKTATRDRAELRAQLTAACEERDRLRAALVLHECADCGQPAFEISPLNPSEGFCWNEHKLLQITASGGKDER